MLRHKKFHRIEQVFELEGSEIELENEVEGSEIKPVSERESNKKEKEEDIMPTFTNIFDILASPFMEV